MLIQDRYASAIRSSNLQTDERTTYSDTDVLGAFGLAAIEHDLPVALQRLFCGDNSASVEIVAMLAWKVRDKAPKLRLRIAETQAVDMARACLAWHRNSRCRACGGHGKLVIPGTKTIGHQDCKVCTGTGTRPFDREFHQSFRELAGWLVSEMERAQSQAGTEAMKKIAPKLEL